MHPQLLTESSSRITHKKRISLQNCVRATKTHIQTGTWQATFWGNGIFVDDRCLNILLVKMFRETAICRGTAAPRSHMATRVPNQHESYY